MPGTKMEALVRLKAKPRFLLFKKIYMLDMLTCNYDLTYHHYEKTLNELCGSVVRNCKFWYQCHTK